MSLDRLEDRFMGWKVSGPNPGIGATNGAQHGTTVANFPEDVDGLLAKVGSRWVYDDLWATWVFDDSGPNGRLVEFWTGQVCP